MSVCLSPPQPPELASARPLPRSSRHDARHSQFPLPDNYAPFGVFSLNNTGAAAGLDGGDGSTVTATATNALFSDFSNQFPVSSPCTSAAPPQFSPHDFFAFDGVSNLSTLPDDFIFDSAFSSASSSGGDTTTAFTFDEHLGQLGGSGALPPQSQGAWDPYADMDLSYDPGTFPDSYKRHTLYPANDARLTHPAAFSMSLASALTTTSAAQSSSAALFMPSAGVSSTSSASSSSGRDDDDQSMLDASASTKHAPLSQLHFSPHRSQPGAASASSSAHHPAANQPMAGCLRLVKAPTADDRERKRAKNTAAARKYRRRRTDRIRELEDALSGVGQERDELRMQLLAAQTEVRTLRGLVSPSGSEGGRGGGKGKERA